ncbi:MAG: arylsulfatase A-like enzyme [Planctomycetota bacterium]|jgi:arylsulfatase A-like enzyme
MSTCRLLLLAAGLFAVGCSDTRIEQVSRPPVRPDNVVLVSIDSLRADHLASYGYHRETSPTLDRMAREGVLFEQVVAESSWTLPTHHSILTGLASNVHGVLSDDVRLSEDHTTLAELFKAAGYRTFGVWSGAYLHSVFGFDQGFDGWVGVGRTAKMDREEFDLAGSKDERRRVINGANVGSHKSRTSEDVTAQALDFLKDVGQRPFFLFLHYFDVHYDYIPPEKYWRRFDPDYAGDYSPEKFISDPAVHADMDERELQHILARYDGEILYVDEYVGQVVQQLELSGLAEQTLVVVTSDHGEEFFEHGYKGHFRTLFDEVLMVPLVFYQPSRLSTGTRIPAQVRHIDIAPTILDWVGLPVPGTMMGTSLASSLTGDQAREDLPAISRLHPESKPGYWISSRNSDWKLVLRHRRATGVTLTDFDLTSDPAELFPAATESAAARAALEAWREFEVAARNELNARNSAVELTDEMQSELDDLGYAE